MRVERYVAVGLFTLLRAGCAADTGPGAAPIVTDRPSVTASSVVVPYGSLQFENGFAATAAQGQDTLDAPETVMRFGLTSKTELRVTVPDYFRQLGSGPGRISGFGDPAIGMKQSPSATGGFAASLVRKLDLHEFSVLYPSRKT
jgi:hypothetical protein